MTYITENPLPGIILFCAIAVVGFLSGTKQGRALSGICLLMAIGLFFLERWLVSPAEEVEQQIGQMLQNFKSDDLPAITRRISSDSPELATIAEKGLDMVQLDSAFHLRSVEVTIGDDDPPVAKALVRANGTLQLRQKGGMSQYIPTFWEMTWHRQQEEWKLKTVQRLDPATGSPMDTFGAR